MGSYRFQQHPSTNEHRVIEEMAPGNIELLRTIWMGRAMLVTFGCMNGLSRKAEDAQFA